jgi:kynurenine formamidase
MENKDAAGVAHYPGWRKEALQYLYEERKITASGHETTDTDRGVATSKDDYALETYVLSADHYQIEALTNMEQVREAGAIVIATFPNRKAAPDFPPGCLQFCATNAATCADTSSSAASISTTARASVRDALHASHRASHW